MPVYTPSPNQTVGPTIASGSNHQITGSLILSSSATTSTLTMLGVQTGSQAGPGSFLALDTSDEVVLATPAGGGSGDVTGPGSATDNAIVRFDGTGGKTIQNSSVTIDDSNNVGGATSLSASDGISGGALTIENGATIKNTNGANINIGENTSDAGYYNISIGDTSVSIGDNMGSTSITIGDSSIGGGSNTTFLYGQVTASNGFKVEGALDVTGDVSASSNISASSFYGSADNLSASYTAHDTANPILSKLDATGKINAENYFLYEYNLGHSYLNLCSNGTTRTPSFRLDHGLPGVFPHRRTTFYSHGTLPGYPFYITRRTTNIYYPITIWSDTSDQSQDKVGINMAYPATASYRFDVSGSSRFQEDVTIDGSTILGAGTGSSPGIARPWTHQVSGTLAVSGTANIYGPVGVGVGGPTIITRNTASFGDDWEQPISGALIISDDIGTGGTVNGVAQLYIHSPKNFAVIGFKNEDTLVGTPTPISQSNYLTNVSGKGAYIGLQDKTMVMRSHLTDGTIQFIVEGGQEVRIESGGTIIGNSGSDNHQVSGTLHVSGGIMQQQYFSASISTPVNATCSLYNVFNYHLTANSEVTASSPVAGTSYLFFFRQDGTGTRTVSFSGFKWPGGTAPTLSTAAGSVDIVSGISDGTYIYADTTKNFS